MFPLGIGEYPPRSKWFLGPPFSSVWLDSAFSSLWLDRRMDKNGMSDLEQHFP